MMYRDILSHVEGYVSVMWKAIVQKSGGYLSVILRLRSNVERGYLPVILRLSFSGVEVAQKNGGVLLSNMECYHE